MKLIKLILTLCIIHCALLIETKAQVTYDSTASFTSKTTIGATDIFGFQTKVSNKFAWRRMIGSNLWIQARDTTQAQLTTFQTEANTWSGVQTFSARPVFTGATFNAGSWGAVTFNDSVLVGYPATLYFTAAKPQYGGNTGSLGSSIEFFYRMYAGAFVVMNSAGTDSGVVSYENGLFTFAGALEADTLKGLSTISHPNIEYSIPVVTDSTITLNYSNVVFFVTPGADITNVEIINMNNIPTASVHIVYFKVHDAGAPYNTVALQDRDGTYSADGNLELNGDCTLTIDDTIVLMYVEGDNVWFEITRSNN